MLSYIKKKKKKNISMVTHLSQVSGNVMFSGKGITHEKLCFTYNDKLGGISVSIRFRPLSSKYENK